MKQCRNCQKAFDGSFCPNCGQKDVDLGRPFWELLGEVVKETLEIDGRAYRTVRYLLTKPGALTAEYLAGRRRSYTPPLRLYLVISVSFFLLVAWLAGRGVLLHAGQTLEEDAVYQARFLSEDLPRLMFVLLPSFALLIKLVFPKRLYFDHVIFSVHLHSASYLLLALTLPLEKIAADHWAAVAGHMLLLCFFLGYFVLSIRRVYEASWIVATLKSFVILLGYLGIVSAVIEASSTFLILSD
jgi:hypothetical protein